MSLLQFLKSAVVEEVQATTRGTGGVRKERNPEGLAIRLFRSGAVYPSQALVDKFDLEYKTGTPTEVKAANKSMESLEKVAGAEVEAAKSKIVFQFPDGEGNGFDLIDSIQWHQLKVGEGFRMLFVSPVPKNEAKVDLFGIVRRDEKTGEPTQSVLEQGAATKGAIMLQMVKEAYGIDLLTEVEGNPDFVDLVITEEVEGFNVTEKFSQPISMFPKVVARGKDEGKPTYERRDNAKIYALIPVSMLGTATEGQEGKSNTTVPGKKSVEALVV